MCQKASGATVMIRLKTVMIRHAEQINCEGERKQCLSEGRNNKNWNLCHFYMKIFVCMDLKEKRNARFIQCHYSTCS